MSLQHQSYDGDGDVYDDRDRVFAGGMICWSGRSVPEQNPDSIHSDPFAAVTRCGDCGRPATRSPCGPCQYRRTQRKGKR